MPCLAVASGCGGDGGSGANEISIEGTWDGGAIPSPGVFLNVTFTVTDADGTIDGDGTASFPGTSCSVGINGTRNGDRFTLTINCPGFAPWSYGGTATANRLNGKFNGSGFTNLTFTMVKD
jgi:hypothetical protein